jgi:hypothetical protein
MNWQYLKDRMKEPSTWRGLALCLTAFGVAMTPEQIAAITVVGLFISGLIGAATPDK